MCRKTSGRKCYNTYFVETLLVGIVVLLPAPTECLGVVRNGPSLSSWGMCGLSQPLVPTGGWDGLARLLPWAGGELKPALSGNRHGCWVHTEEQCPRGTISVRAAWGGEPLWWWAQCHQAARSA